jgi:hypothetical protein
VLCLSRRAGRIRAREMLEALAGGIESRLVTGTLGAILEDLAGRLI